MNAKELIEQLKGLPEETEIVLHRWSDEKGSIFAPLSPACSQQLEGKFILRIGI